MDELLAQSQGLDLTRLPKDYAPVGLAEAQELFAQSLLPFVSRMNTIRSVPVVLASDRNLTPEYKAKLWLRFNVWDHDYKYYTLDLQGQRWILKDFGRGSEPNGDVEFHEQRWSSRIHKSRKRQYWNHGPVRQHGLQ